MRRRVMRTASLCLLAGVLAVGTGSLGVLAEEEVTAETDGEAGESLVGELIFAQCEDYINIRSSADPEGEVTAKIFNNGSATVVSEEKDGWLGITSGNASGYVKGDYFATGEEAEAIAKDVAYVVAVLQADEVTIRSEASADSVALDCANTGDELEVVEDDGDWLRVARGNGLYGYIHADYVEVKTYYPVAKTLEELEAEEEIEIEDTEEEADEEYEDYYEEDYEEDISFYEESSTYEDSYTETSWEETSYTETYTYEETYTETSAPDVTEETIYTEAAYAETETPATEAATEAASASSETSSDAGIVTDSTYNGDEYYYDANEDAYYYGSTRIESYSVSPAVEEAAEAAEETAAAEIEEEEAVYEESAYEETVCEETGQEEAEQEAVQVQETEASSTSSAGSSVSGQDIATYATQYIGNDYVYGGTSLTDGADCSGFVQSVYAEYDISVARVAADQAAGGTTVDTDELEAGDLLFYSSDGENIDHVAIYIGDDTIVHAANSERGIVTDYAYYDEPVTAVRYY